MFSFIARVLSRFGAAESSESESESLPSRTIIISSSVWWGLRGT
jgi:hypothetical protein